MMMIFLRILGALLIAVTLVACASLALNSGREALPEKPAGALRIATWNVHYIVLRDAEGPWSVGDWEVRKGPMDDAFKAVGADVFAFQEMESFRGGSDGSVNLARDWLLEQNPDYRLAASGPWRKFPPTQPMLYREDRLRLLEQGWFFFSETPDVIYSRTFDGSYPAFASWARFAPADRGAPFRIVNVHFEYSSGSNRLKSAALVVERVRPWVEAGEAVVLVGDINALHHSRTMEVLEGAGLTFAPVDGSTYHFDRGINLFGAIDHIALSEGIELVGGPVVVRRQFRGEWPSDHYPVVADVVLP